jgi:hypothetical protein
MTETRSRRARRRVVAVLAMASAIAVAGATPGWAGGGKVMPASAKPHGYSLVDMTKELALFSTSGNNPAHYPDTPFQILYTANFDAQPVGGGIVVTGTNSFRVAKNTKFFVPLVNVTDSPPVLGVYPTTPAEATTYIFEPSQVGVHGFEIVVDGTSTPIGAEYLAGPVTTPVDVGGTHTIALGAFLNHLRHGTHTVEIRGTLGGDLVAATYGLDFTQHFTYTVDIA